MAKKTTGSKTAPKADAPAPPTTPTPRARTAAPKKKKAAVATAIDPESTILSAEPSDEAIRVRAYHRYLERGGGHGMDFEDWLEAKRELRELTEKK